MPIRQYFAYLLRAEDYKRRAAEIADPTLKRAYEAAAAEFLRRADEVKGRDQGG